MRWFFENYKWLFDGALVAVALLLAQQFLKR
jgi:hypothetical protein